MTGIADKLAHMTTEPGVYLMKDRAGSVLYVGKAANLRSRVRSYFQDSAQLTPQKQQMISQVEDIDFVVVNSETEALILEITLIQQHRPHYNVRLKDDKHYPFIRIGVGEPFPALMVVRRPARDGARYFGPYTSTQAMWETIRVLRHLFGVRFARRNANRACSGHPWDPTGPKRRRPCLDYFIGRCLGPCTADTVTADEYARAVARTIEFLDGRTDDLLARLRADMQQASNELRFEAAAKLRDRVLAIEQTTEKQRVFGDRQEDLDLVALAMGQDMACVVVSQVRRGRLIGQSRFLLEGVTGMSESAVLTEFVKSYYPLAASPPQQIALEYDIEEKTPLAALIEQQRAASSDGRARGRVRLFVPRRGEKRELIELTAKNARRHLDDALGREEVRTRKVEEALIELRDALCLPTAPRRIECYDISNLFGKQAVGSMVVFEDGRASKGEYRRFRIRLKQDTPDDFAMMREVLDRRLRAGIDGAPRFDILPDLILVDGGKGQLNVALNALSALDLRIPAAGLAKEFEHVFVPGQGDPVILPRHSRALHLLQAVRDEAHRFAIAYHRTLRREDALASVLRTTPGIGPKRQRALLTHFSSLDEIRQATVEELAAVAGMSRPSAEALLTNLRSSDQTAGQADTQE